MSNIPDQDILSNPDIENSVEIEIVRTNDPIGY